MAKVLQQDVSNRIGDVIKTRFKKIKNQFALNLKNVFSKAYDRAVQVGVDLGGDKAPKQNIKKKAAAVQKMMHGDIDMIGNEQTQATSRVIAQSYAQGLPSLKLKQQVADTVGQSGYKLDRAIRTNTAYLASITKLMTWDEMGFTNYDWVLGKSDKNTRPYHKWLHGRTFKIKDALAGRAPIPGRVPKRDGSTDLSQSINCRCGIKLSSNQK